MRRISSSSIVVIIILCLLFAALSGCARSQPASAKAGLTVEQAINAIVSDLRQHGIVVQKISINQITPHSSGTSASVVFVITLQDGRTLTQKVNLVKDKNKWFIEGHNH